MKKYETIELELTNKKAVLTLNRPEQLNTMNLLMVEELIDALLYLKACPLHVLILTGKGRKFCAGADMAEMQERDAVLWGRIVERYLDIIRAQIDLPFPIIAAINGDAVGGGLGLCVASDIRIAVNTVRVGFPFIKIGLAGSDMGSSYFLPKLVGFGMAAEMLYTGRLLAADEAVTFGLLHRSVGAQDLEKEVEAFAENFIKGPAFALRFTRQALFRSLDNDRERQFDFETYAQTQCLQSKDHQTGIEAYRSKRAPEYAQQNQYRIA